MCLKRVRFLLLKSFYFSSSSWIKTLGKRAKIFELGPPSVSIVLGWWLPLVASTAPTSIFSVVETALTPSAPIAEFNW